jgi:hypothetical protein
MGNLIVCASNQSGIVAAEAQQLFVTALFNNPADAQNQIVSASRIVLSRWAMPIVVQ